MEEKKKSTGSSKTKSKSVSTKSKKTNVVKKKSSVKIEKTIHNSEEKNNTKETSSKRKNSSDKKKNNDKDMSLLIMKIVFFALIVLICVLLVAVINKKKEQSKELVAKMTFPVIEEESKMPFSIDLTEVKENDEYIFKVTNYRNDKVIDKDINYTITVINNTDSKIKLYRGKSNVDLMKDQKNTEITDLKVYKNEKEDVYFRVVFDDLKNVKEKDMIDIIIESK